jgi:hypothetical protein
MRSEVPALMSVQRHLERHPDDVRAVSLGASALRV